MINWHPVAAAAAAVAAPYASVRTSITTSASHPAQPITLRTSPAGSGIGFVATRDVREGEVLLVSPPLFPPLSGSNRTQPPSGLDLARHVQTLQPAFSSVTQQWLRLLHVGGSDPGSEESDAPLRQDPENQPSSWQSEGGAVAGVHRLSRLQQLLPASSEDGQEEGGASFWDVEVRPVRVG